MGCIAAGYGAERLLEDQAVGSMSDMGIFRQPCALSSQTQIVRVD